MPHRAIVLIALFAVPSLGHARTWEVRPDGTGDVPTIRAGVDSAAAGDSVRVACGTYYENEIVVDTSLTLLSENEDPGCVTIDADAFEVGHVLSILPGAEFALIGITITGGWEDAAALSGCTATIVDCIFTYNDSRRIYADGGALWIGTSSVEIRGCRFDHNGSGDGGAVYCVDSSVLLDDCVLSDNIGRMWGGAIWCHGGSVSLVRCTLQDNWGMRAGGVLAWSGDVQIVDSVLQDNVSFYQGGACYSRYGAVITITGSTLVGNSAPTGAGLYCQAGIIHADHTIVANGRLGAAAWAAEGGTMALSCCDVYGNQYGDWLYCLYGQDGVDGNFSADPLFCDPDDDDFTLRSNSPCAPPGATGCGRIGALPVGCGPVAIEALSWGKIKGAYR
jgi:hypothetical protein